MGAPHEPRGVHGQAVRHAVRLVNGGENTAIGDGAGGGVEVEGDNGLAAAVREVHGAVVGAPAQAVRQNDVGKQPLDGVIVPDTIERATGLPLLHVGAVHPEAAAPVALTVVKAVLRQAGLRRGEDLKTSQGVVDETQTAIEPGDETAAFALHDAADLVGLGEAVPLARSRVEAMNRPADDIDPVERLLVGAPVGRLAQLGLGRPDTVH